MKEHLKNILLATPAILLLIGFAFLLTYGDSGESGNRIWGTITNIGIILLYFALIGGIFGLARLLGWAMDKIWGEHICPKCGEHFKD